MAELPNSKTSEVDATILVSNLAMTRQYGAWWSLAGNPRVGMILRDGSQTWGVNHTETIGNAELFSALSAPVTNDEHNYLALGISYNNDATVRRIYISGNMHGGNPGDEGDFKMARTTTTDGSIASWEAVASLPGMGSGALASTEWTYPTFIHHANGDLGFMLRVNISGNGDWYYWRLPKGSDTWGSATLTFKGIDGGIGGADRSCYFSPPSYDDARGRWWMSGIWRDNSDEGEMLTNDSPFAIQLQDDFATPRGADGEVVGWPIDELTRDSHPGMFLPDDHTGGETTFLNWGGPMAIDDDGNPHLYASRNPAYHWTWDGEVDGDGEWVQSRLGTSAGLVLLGIIVLDVPTAVWLRGKLWFVAMGGTVSSRRFPYAWRMSTPTTAEKLVPLGHMAASGIGWGVCVDRVALRHGLLEVLTPDGNIPRVVAISANGPRSRVG